MLVLKPMEVINMTSDLKKAYEKAEAESLKRQPKAGKQLGVTAPQMRKLVNDIFAATGKDKLLLSAVQEQVGGNKEVEYRGRRMQLVSALSVKKSGFTLKTDDEHRVWIHRA